jgi:hypothetical protein
MNKFRFTVKLVVIATFLLAFASIAQAQATRTWVSGVGDDVNPCSRTAPCKTWAGAISKTAIHGEIDALDPGGYGTLNITKSITIDGTLGAGFGSTLASGTNGFIINIAPNANDPFREVILRNLSINGSGSSGGVGTRTGLDGVRFIQGLTLTIENCRIFAFSGDGVEVSIAADNGKVMIRDTVIQYCTGDGIRLTGTGFLVRVTLDNVRSERNGNGLHVVNAAVATVDNSRFSHNTSDGVVIEGSAGFATIRNSTMSSNGNDGLQAGAGASNVRLNNSTLFDNAGAGVNIAGGTVFTFGGNIIRVNNPNITGGALNATETLQ